MRQLTAAVSIFSLLLVFATQEADAQGRVSCNHDPVCQAQRDGTTVAEARRRDRAVTKCIQSAGYAEEDWRAYRVPAGPAEKIRACFRRERLPM